MKLVALLVTAISCLAYAADNIDGQHCTKLCMVSYVNYLRYHDSEKAMEKCNEIAELYRLRNFCSKAVPVMLKVPKMELKDRAPGFEWQWPTDNDAVAWSICLNGCRNPIPKL